MDDVLAKNPADKMIIARQRWLAARSNSEALKEELDKALDFKQIRLLEKSIENAEDLERRALREWALTLKEFDNTYGERAE